MNHSSSFQHRLDDLMRRCREDHHQPTYADLVELDAPEGEGRNDPTSTESTRSVMRSGTTALILAAVVLFLVWGVLTQVLPK